MFEQALTVFLGLLAEAWDGDWPALAMKFFPWAVLVELPVFLLVLAGILRYALRQAAPPAERIHYPTVSCILTCYTEGPAVARTILTLAQQRYAGEVELIAVVDGARRNEETLHWARACQERVERMPRRRLVILPKWQRGGRVSSLNAGLAQARGEVVLALDGDTSFDHDMIERVTRHFEDPRVVAVAGGLRVRNVSASLATRLQAVEYVLSIVAGRTGLAEFNLLNNISGAFGVFRAGLLRALGGWGTGSAEDLDITLRIKQYLARQPDLRMVFDPRAVGLTDAPDTFAAYLRQRLRWEGDLYYLLVRKYRLNLRPGLMGWPNCLAVLLGGLFIQVLMPFAILGYLIVLFASQPPGVALGLLAFIYLAYLAALALLYGLHLAVLSERPREDLALLPVLLLSPLFALVSRLWSAVAIAMSAAFHSHLDSPMAPWWVLKRGRF